MACADKKYRGHTHFIYQKKVNTVWTQLDSEYLLNSACFSKESNKRVKMGQQYTHQKKNRQTWEMK